jgi:hypothetical protein
VRSLVTGGAGFVERYVSPALLDRGLAGGSWDAELRFAARSLVAIPACFRAAAGWRPRFQEPGDVVQTALGRRVRYPQGYGDRV